MRKASTVVLVSLLSLVTILAGSFGNQPAQAATGREPVIVIPGIGGSTFTATNRFTLSVDNGRGGTFTRTYNEGENVWVNIFQAALPGSDDYFDAMKLTADGDTPVAPQLELDGVFGLAYNDLVDYLEDEGYEQNVDLWLFPYDWRRDIRTTNSQLDTLVTEALTAVNGGNPDPASWSITRVDIVGHSMGGMVGRSYVSDPARASRVDQLLTLGSPQLGTTKFLKTLVYGDNFGPTFLGLGLNPDEVKDVVQNMSGAAQLLPSREYYTYYDNSDEQRLRPYIEDRDVDGDGVARGVLSYDEVDQLLRNLDKNSIVLDKAETYHDALDTQRNGGVNGVRWDALVGYGFGTQGQIIEFTGTCFVWFRVQACDKRDELPVDGDGTVTRFSAAMGDPDRGNLIDSGAELWYVEREHGALVQKDRFLGIPTDEGAALRWLGDRLRDSSTSVDVRIPKTRNPDLVTRQPLRQLTGMWVSALGPVALTVEDQDGNTMGREAGSDSAMEDTIAEALYERSPGSEFAFLKGNNTYQLKLISEQQGSVDVKVRVYDNGRLTQTAVYMGVPLDADGNANLTLQPASTAATLNSWPMLVVDADGDGVQETDVQPDAILDAEESADITAPELLVEQPDVQQDGEVAVQWRTNDDNAGMLNEHAFIDDGTGIVQPVVNGEMVDLPSGDYTLQVIAQDQAGNAQSYEVDFQVP